MVRRKAAQPRREAMGGLSKGLAVIRAFTREHGALTLSEIARGVAMPAATARRCLLTLEELGYVMRSGRGFLLRPKVLELGAAYLESMNIEQLTKTHLEAHVGSRFPAHATSTGRVLLAGLSAAGLETYFKTARLEALTDRTVVDPGRLRQLIDDCRRSGYAAVEDELAYGVVALGVPVFDHSRRVVAALNTSSHSRKITKTKLVRDRLAMLQEVSRQISADLAEVQILSLSAEA